jgi:hypothetical protein
VYESTISSAFATFKLLIQQTDFREGWYEYLSIKGYTKAHSISLQLLTTAHQTNKILERFRHEHHLLKLLKYSMIVDLGRTQKFAEWLRWFAKDN